MKIRDFLKINLAQALITNKNNVNSKDLTKLQNVYREGRTGLLSAMCANASLQTVKLWHFSVLSKSLPLTK
jgi:hypothetical protein